MNFDYVVVGAGAAGCAVASRLSEDPEITVLLLEAGPRSWATHLGQIPRAMPAVLRSRLLTSYETRPLAQTGRPDYWVRGRGVGGSTLVNGMMYLRGEPAAYDELAAATSTHWAWAAFSAAYGEIEGRFIRPSSTSLTALDRTMLDSFESTGLDIVADLNATSGPRAGAAPATIDRGRRVSAAAFFDLAQNRANLRILRATTAESLIWQGRRVVGVLAAHGQERREIHASEVVLCAGAIETPLLLERSGIGQPGRLGPAGIDVRVDSPRVGEGLREQRGHGLQVRLKPGVTDAMELGSARAIGAQAARYLATRGGALARPAYDVAALLTSGRPARSAVDTKTTKATKATKAVDADIQVLAAPFALADGHVLRPAGYPGVLLSGYPIRPSTTSSIHIDPAAPAGPPVIDARFVETEADQLLHDASMSALRRLAYAGPLGELIIGEDHSWPGSPGSAIYHAVGSAAMGTSSDDVTDPDLRVRGAQGLRIADLSVLPFHLSGGTAAPAMALGWLAGKLLIAEHHGR